MREGSLFKSFDILKSRSSEKLYPKTFKKYGIEGWRGTSEGFDFKNWFYKL
jgi:hypothetical protein